MNNPRLISCEDVADILGVTVPRVYELARQNIIPAVRLGRQVRVDAHRLEDFLQSGGKALEGGWRHEA